MTRFRLSVHLVISNATLASDENGYSLHKNVGEYRDEERSRTGTRILVRKGLETEWNEVIPRGGTKVVPSNAKSWFIWGSVEFRIYDSLPYETVIDDNNIDSHLPK